jgi:hypothetical protein
MTAVDALPVGTATGPTVRSTWRRNRVAVATAAGLVAVLAVLALVTGVGKGGTLDPASYAPQGAHALAVLLQDQGVTVHRTTDVAGTLSGATGRTTVLVPTPALLSHEELAALAAGKAPLVVVGAGPEALLGLGADAEAVDLSDPTNRTPQCALPAAERAGRARAGGFAYRPTSGGLGCYPAGDGVALLSLPAQQLVLVGSPDAFTNDRLGEEGNAALGLGLLGQGSEVRWFVPDPARDTLGPVPPGSPNDLLPSWLRLAAVQLGVALLVLALWRARRLGRVVPERLPVAVRAAETVEGRGRLYRAAAARGTAAEALRAGARDRLAQRVGAGRTPSAQVLVSLLATRTTTPSAQVQALLYGPSPADDAALVRLADDLDALILEVAGS